MVDRARAQAEFRELRPRYESILPLGQYGDCALNVTSLSFTLYFNVNLRRVAHAGQGGAAWVTGG